jgi:FkbM family methyltransferase
MSMPGRRTIKRLVRAELNRHRLELIRSDSVPFGWDWTRDVAALAPDIRVAFDVGANVGQTVAGIKGRFPNAQIWCFEPVPATFATLAATVADIPTVHPIQSALGAAPGTATITASACAQQNTIVPGAALQGAGTIGVSVDTVDRMMDEHGIDVVDLLKIDTEGYEIEVLMGAGRALRDGRVRLILAECDFTPHPKEPHTPFERIIELLYPLGYRVVTFYTGGVDHQGWLWGDCLFMRSSDRASTPFRSGPSKAVAPLKNEQQPSASLSSRTS